MSGDNGQGQAIEIELLKLKQEQIEKNCEKLEEAVLKITENCTMLSQRIVGLEEREGNTDYLLKWLLGVVVGSFAGIMYLLITIHFQK